MSSTRYFESCHETLLFSFILYKGTIKISCSHYSYNHSLQVEFMGVPGEDGGGLLREFWTILFEQIAGSYFEKSSESAGCCPRHDTVALQVFSH